MKTLPTVVALSVLALTACSEESPGTATSSDAQGGITNPFGPQEDDPAMGGGNGLNTGENAGNGGNVGGDFGGNQGGDLGGNQGGNQGGDFGNNEGGTDTGGNGSTDIPSGDLDIRRILNGSTASTASSFWSCSDGGGSFALSFYADNTGSLSDSTDSFTTNWTVGGPYLELTVQGQYFAQFTNLNINTSGQQFAVDFVLFDGESGSLDCVLNAGGTTVDTGGNGGGVSEQPSQGSLENTLTSEGALSNLWACQLADGTAAYFVFLQQNLGVFANADYEAIEFSWNQSGQGVGITLADGNQITFSAPQFSSVDEFQVNSVNVLGTSVAGMSCTLASI